LVSNEVGYQDSLQRKEKTLEKNQVGLLIEKLVKVLKNKYATNGSVVKHPEYGEVIQLQGDQRENVKQFFIEVGIAKKEQIKLHGF
jgi:translation initiation factor SUI1